MLKVKFLFFTLTLLFISACNDGASPQLSDGSENPDALSTEEIRTITRDLYIFTYPLVMNYRTMYMQAIKDDGAFGKWLHLGLASPQDADIVTPNNDTPYSYAWLDLRSEPWVLSLPAIEDERYYTSQWDDLWGYVIDNPGSVLDGNAGYNYLLVAPGWNGDLPEGINRIIRGESDFLGSLTRTQITNGEQDMPRVREIQQAYALQPLSAYTNTSPPPQAPAIDWPEWTEGDETGIQYFDYVNFLFPFITSNLEDSTIYSAMEEIGLGPDTQWSSEELSAVEKEAFRQGIADARAELARLAAGDFDPADFFGKRERISTDYVNRALGVFGNEPEQAVYFTKPNDWQGLLTDGSQHSYTITFSADSLPPVKYFWSYTMYRLPERLLVDNSLERYSIGSNTPGLKRNEDGSITLYFSYLSPGAELESNWLPTPDGAFWSVLRAYGPDDEILNKSWQPPGFEYYLE